MEKETAFITLLIAAIVVGCIFWVKSGWIDTYITEGKVKDKFIDAGSGAYVVILYDNTKLEVDRNLWYSGSEFNPDVVYASIKVNNTYRFTCWGWQLDFWIIYWYANVIKAEPTS